MIQPLGRETKGKVRFEFFKNHLNNISSSGFLPTLLEKFWRISLYLTYDAIAKLYVT